MLDVLHYSFKALKRTSVIVVALAVLTGCSAVTTGKTGFALKSDKSVSGAEVKDIASEPTIDSIISGATKPSKQAAAKPFTIDVNGSRRSVAREKTAACRYLEANAAAEAAIIGSPTVNASSDEDGSGSVSLGMNLLDFKKADLVRASGEAKCRLHESSKNVEATLGLGVEATKFAHAWAKQNHIRQNLRNLNAVQARANSLVKQGIITTQDANSIEMSVAELKSTMEINQAEASQRANLPAVNAERIKSSHGSLIAATNDLQNIERDIRSNDAFQFSVSAGYRYNDTFNDNLQRDDNGGAFARVSVGVRLGALSAQRQQFESDASLARLDALVEENSGAIWKSEFSTRAMKDMSSDLRKSERELIAAVAETNETIAKLNTEDSPEVVKAMLIAKIEKVRIGANLAAVRAAIGQLEENRRNIRALSQ